ncbi:methyltransferase type 11 [Echinicola strongylocentroti]|uniref:Methyltransferase type 11 n=1 Tax=Echinicola strongylocentroti TaxID=1795355 RepID=A0A2Z4ILS3_9BACT|nr:methyltransferase domain-containing protein [Echinicola strongylocentroti]AWW32072.1 methyltransferase type 11 [Echinicola strongylocentroti]
MDNKGHQDRVIRQFTQQAKGYSSISSHRNALDKLVQMAAVKSEDSVLDVACGTGMVACEFARFAGKVTGIDITTEMLKEAQRLHNKMNLKNIVWHLGNANPLPFEEGAFSVVVSRFSFHHFLEPDKVLQEMIRVCQPGGRVIVADVCLPESKVDHYNVMEKIRDTSHTAALSHRELDNLMKFSGLKAIKNYEYRMKIGLEQQLDASFAVDTKKLREMIQNDIDVNRLGIDASREANGIYLHYPIRIYCGVK